MMGKYKNSYNTTLNKYLKKMFKKCNRYTEILI